MNKFNRMRMFSHKASRLTMVLIWLFVGYSCQEDPDFNREINAGSIDALISEVGTLPPPPEPALKEIASLEDSLTEDSNGTRFNCSAKEFELNSVFSTLTLSSFDDRAATNTASLYPGSIVKLKDLVESDELNGIGAYERQPIEISSTLGDIRLVEDPGQRGNVDRQIKDMESLHNDFAANVRFETTESYSLEQSMLELGINVSNLGNSVKSKLRVESTVEQKNIFIRFLQVYHTVSIANPIRPSDFFGPSVTEEDLRNVTGINEPLGFISEVAYGRVLVGKFTYRGSRYRTAAELDVEIRKGLANIEAGVAVENSSEFSNSTFEVAILGGSAEEASQVSGSGLEAVQAAYDFIKDGGSDPSLGVPIQYKVKFLSDNSTVATGGVARYQVPDCNFVPTRIKINRISILAIPPLNGSDKNWDTNCGLACNSSKHPDPFFQIEKGNSIQFTSSSFTNVQPDDLPKRWDVSNRNFEYGVNDVITIIIRDDDDSAIPSNADKMGEVKFTLNQHAGKNQLIGSKGQTRIQIDGTWK